MAIVVALVLAFLALIFVLYPLYGKKERGLQPALAVGEQPGPSEQMARTALQEVELDYQLGNLAETDYRTLRERYTQRALTGMKERYEREQELDALIEEQLRRMKEESEDDKEQQ